MVTREGREKLAALAAGREVAALREFGAPADLARSLGSSVRRGLPTDAVARNRRLYGENRLPTLARRTLLGHLVASLRDPVLLVLLFAGAVTTVYGVALTHETADVVEGGAILAAVAVVAGVQSVQNFAQDARLAALEVAKADRQISVMRDGREQSVSVFDLVVGDMVVVRTGDALPGDGILIRGTGVRCDESTLTGESREVSKAPFVAAAPVDSRAPLPPPAPGCTGGTSWSDADTDISDDTAVPPERPRGDSGLPVDATEAVADSSSQRLAPPFGLSTGSEAGRIAATGSEQSVEVIDPFMLSGAQVVAGTGRMLVIAVGTSSSYGQIVGSIERAEPPPTPMQVQLAKVARAIGWFGLAGGVLTFAVLMIAYLVMHRGAYSTDDTLHATLSFLIVAVAVVICAVPEGLPLAVTLALSFSTKRMIRDAVLTRELMACETMGSVSSICTDKTGTLTLNQMTVSQVWVGGQLHSRVPTAAELVATGGGRSGGSSHHSGHEHGLRLPPVVDELAHAIALNSDARIKLAPAGSDADTSAGRIAESVGNHTEAALLYWMAAHYGAGYEQLRTAAGEPAFRQPFSSQHKRMSSAYRAAAKDLLVAEGDIAVVAPAETHKRSASKRRIAVAPLPPAADAVPHVTISLIADDADHEDAATAQNGHRMVPFTSTARDELTAPLLRVQPGAADAASDRHAALQSSPPAGGEPLETQRGASSQRALRTSDAPTPPLLPGQLLSGKYASGRAQVASLGQESPMPSLTSAPSSDFVVYTKGAPEAVLELCSHYRGLAGEATPLTADARLGIQDTVASMTKAGLRALAVAARYTSANDVAPRLQAALASGSSRRVAAAWERSASDGSLARGSTLLAVVGISDPIRPEVPPAVDQCKRAGIRVRMVTGDNSETARKIASACGLLTSDGICMEGKEYRALSAAQREDVSRRLDVLSRAVPQDKLLLVTTLEALNEAVAVTGDGTNDAPALRAAHVGCAMGSGTEVAKQASKMVILDDNLASLAKAVLWGRSIRENVRKFLAFQLTINISAGLFTLIMACVRPGRTEDLPLSAMALLWVNLIMDSFAALALATEPPDPALMTLPPEPRDCSLVTPTMGKYIVAHAAFQIGLLLFLTLSPLGFRIFLLDSAAGPQATACLNTCIFNSFVLLQLWNLLNVRKLHDQLDLISQLHKSRIGLVVVVVVVLGHWVIVQYGGSVFKTVPLTAAQWGICVAVGALSIVVGYLLRFIPARSWRRRAATA